MLTGCGGSAPGSRADRQAAPTQSASPSDSPVAAARVRTALATWHLPRPISRAVAFAGGARILLVGGLVPGDRSIGAVTALDPVSGASHPRPALRQPSHDAAGIRLAGADYLIGGGDAAGLAVVQRVGASGPSTVVGALPQPRSDLVTAVVGSRGYVLGGYTGTSLPSQVLVTRNGRHFRPHGALAVPVRYAAAVATGSAIYLFGGLDASGNPVSDIQRYDPRNGRTRVIGQLPAALSGASAVAMDGRILVAGGRLASGATTGAVLMWDAGHLHRVARLRRPVANAASVVADSTAWLLGGESASDLSTVQTIRLAGGRR